MGTGQPCLPLDVWLRVLDLASFVDKTDDVGWVLERSCASVCRGWKAVLLGHRIDVIRMIERHRARIANVVNLRDSTKDEETERFFNAKLEQLRSTHDLLLDRCERKAYHELVNDAEHGDAVAQCRLARHLLSGDRRNGLEHEPSPGQRYRGRDYWQRVYDDARRWYEASAASGFAPAQYALATDSRLCPDEDVDVPRVPGGLLRNDPLVKDGRLPPSREKSQLVRLEVFAAQRVRARAPLPESRRKSLLASALKKGYEERHEARPPQRASHDCQERL